MNKSLVSFEPQLLGGFGEKNSNKNKYGEYTQWFQQDRVYNPNCVAMCHPANIPGGSYLYLVIIE